ncbi:MAG: tetratricopeptide repeat protein [Cytophagales bacterium]|nr:tetratricopeptide repeat protein [Cytophagales bacterium]
MKNIQYPIFSRLKKSWVLLIILAVTFIAFSPVLKNGFTNWDDDSYVLENKLIKELSYSNVKKIFTTYKIGNYHPLTILSYAIEYHFFQSDAYYYHLTNLLLHLLNTLLVYWLIYAFFTSLTASRNAGPMSIRHRPLPSTREDFANTLSSDPGKQALYIAGITAILFGIHPLHVESVAWISARKDVLSTFFFLGALVSYVLYLRWQNIYITTKTKTADENKSAHFRVITYYVFALILFIFSVLSKAMAVTLPVLLILINALSTKPRQLAGHGAESREQVEDPDAVGGAGSEERSRVTRYAMRYAHTIPFFIISIIFGIIAIIAQHSSEAFHDLKLYSVIDRLLFASYGLISYILKLIIPSNLSCFYPYPEKINGFYPMIVYISPFILLILIYVIVKYIKYRAVVGGLIFFIINILLVLQIIPVGEAHIADRYTYIPYIGLFFIIGWGASILIYSSPPASRNAGPMSTGHRPPQRGDFTKPLLLSRLVINFILPGYIIILSIVTWYRCHIWENSFTLWNDVLKKHENVWIAYNNRGLTYLYSNQFDKAIRDFSAASSLRQDLPRIYFNRAYAYYRSGESKLAFEDCNYAISLDVNNAKAYANRGSLYFSSGNYNQALKDFNMALALDAELELALINRAKLFTQAGELDKAIADLSRLIALNPIIYLTYHNRGNLYHKKGEFEKAILDLNKVIEMNPEFIEAYYNRAYIYLNSGKYLEATKDYSKVIDLNSGNVQAYNNRGVAWYRLNEFQKAYYDLQKAKELGFEVDDNLLENILMRMNEKKK